MSGAATPTASGSGTGTHAGVQGPFREFQATSKPMLTLRDFEIVNMDATVEGPRVFFIALNDGPSDHELVVAAEAGAVKGHLEPFERQNERTLAVELTPGRYVVECRLETPEGRTHADLGMRAAFSVVAAPG